MDYELAQRVKREWEMEKAREQREQQIQLIETQIETQTSQVVPKSLYDDLLQKYTQVIGNNSNNSGNGNSGGNNNNNSNGNGNGNGGTTPPSTDPNVEANVNLTYSITTNQAGYYRLELNLDNDIDIYDFILNWENLNPDYVGCNMVIQKTDRINCEFSDKTYDADDFKNVYEHTINYDLFMNGTSSPVINSGNGAILYIDFYGPIVFDFTHFYFSFNGFGKIDDINVEFNNGNSKLSVEIPINTSFLETEEYANRFRLNFKDSTPIYYNADTDKYSEESVGVNVIYRDHSGKDHEYENIDDLPCSHKKVFYYYESINKESFEGFDFYNYENTELLNPAPVEYFAPNLPYEIALNPEPRTVGNNNVVYNNIYFELLIGYGKRVSPIITGFVLTHSL